MSSPIDVFVSAVLVVRDAEDRIEAALRRLHDTLEATVTDYELVVVDNASTDRTVEVVSEAAQVIPNVQLYCLSRAVDRDAATFAGIEHAIGDYVVLLEPRDGQIDFIPTMIAQAALGNDIVFAEPKGGLPSRGLLDRLLVGLFLRVLRLTAGVDLGSELLRFRLLSRQVINLLLQHENAPLILQTLPSIAAYPKATVTYEETDSPPDSGERSVAARAEKGIGALLSVTTAPARLTTVVSLLAGLLNVLYAVYVVAIYFLKEDVQEGWTTMSLQISGMFFLFSIVLALLSEYVIRIFQGGLGRPAYHIAREVRSPAISREERLNVLGAAGAGAGLSGAPADPEGRDAPATR